jgi:hypothetical protein
MLLFCRSKGEERCCRADTQGEVQSMRCLLVSALVHCKILKGCVNVNVDFCIPGGPKYDKVMLEAI